MKQICLLFLICFSVLFTKVQSQRTISFDRDWRFKKDSLIGAEKPAYDDKNWRKLDLPHDWSIEDLPDQIPDSITGPFHKGSIGGIATGFTVGGTGWYRKKFLSEKSFLNHLVTIYFDGIYMNSDVWLNGHHLGNRPYGYTPFYYDLAPYLNSTGQENVLAVRVRNEGKNSRWCSGSGIYRHVLLIVTGPVHVVPWGVYITTPEVSAGRATIQIKTDVNNESSSQKYLSLVTTILSPGGQAVGSNTQSLVLDGKALKQSSQSIILTNPNLWSVETPQLYKAMTEIKEGTNVLDRVETSFGIRSITIDAVNGLAINGKNIPTRSQASSNGLDAGL